jgi:prepilin-type N-terminal cleavage/methylation domain-containing protein
MSSRTNLTPMAAAAKAAGAATLRPLRATRLALQPVRFLGEAGFTLTELLVSMAVLVVLVLLATQLLNSAATITTLGHKQMGADSEARQLLDRMAIDFTQMVKRNDVDYFAKGTAAPNSVGGPMSGNDQIAFYGNVPGYYPSTGSQSPVSLVAYRINSLNVAAAFNKLERLGKGLVWNGVSATDKPVIFWSTFTSTWPAATSSSLADSDGNYEIMGPQVFRFEYYYLLKGQTVNGTTYASIPSSVPWDTRVSTCCATSPGSPCCHDRVWGMQDVAAIIAHIAVIDPKSKVLLTNAQIATFSTSGAANFLSDYTAGMTPGQLRAQWQTTLNGITSLPRPAISGIRLYERYFYLSPPTQ